MKGTGKEEKEVSTEVFYRDVSVFIVEFYRSLTYLPSDCCGMCAREKSSI